VVQLLADQQQYQQNSFQALAAVNLLLCLIEKGTLGAFFLISSQMLKIISSLATIAFPFLLGYGVLPLPNLINEIAACLGFGLLLVVAYKETNFISLNKTHWVMLSVGIVLIASVINQWIYSGRSIYWDCYFFYISYIAIAMLALHFGWKISASAETLEQWLKAISISFLVAGAITVLASFMQYFELANSWALIPYISERGRAFGFVRQPNHQAMLLVICCHVLIYQYKQSKITGWIFGMIIMWMSAGVLMTGSRTGFFLLLSALVWAGFGVKKHDQKRVLISIATAMAAIAITVLILYATQRYYSYDFYATQKLSQTSREGFGVRALLWEQSIKLILEYPMLGVGIIRYPSLFFLSGAAVETKVLMTNAHNILLQLAIEHGIIVLTYVICVAIFVMRKLGSGMSIFPETRMSLGIVFSLLIYSMVEFPLWYSYFLIPAMVFLGIATGRAISAIDDRCEFLPATIIPTTPSLKSFSHILVGLAGIAIVGTAAWINSDFYKITPIFLRAQPELLGERLDIGQKVTWFKRYAIFVELLHEKVSDTNARRYVEQAEELGCSLVEPLYQSELIVALAYQNRVDAAKQLLYLYWKMSGGATEHLKKKLSEHSGDAFAELSLFLESPKAVELIPASVLPCMK
jgi:Virulence factor membrane-bound polymerase, C-terminal/O-Antigen ligase